MSDRADEVAAAAVARFHVLWGVKWYPDARTFDLEKHQTDTGREVEHQVQVIAAALRAYAEEARREERTENAAVARTVCDLDGIRRQSCHVNCHRDVEAAIRARGEGKG